MSTTKSFKVFIVDDDPMFNTMLQDYLSEHNKNYELHEFLSGEECINNLSLEPDAIVLDYYLDNVDKKAKNGLEILKKIKDKEPELPVVMLSGQEKYGVAAQTIMQGAIHYIMKDNNAFEETHKMLQSLLTEKV